MNKTKIEWADSTWNPITGCLHGCDYCYAMRIANRFKGWTSGGEKITFNPYGNLPELKSPMLLADRSGKVKQAPYPFAFEPTLHRYRLNDFENKSGRNIFVCSMADMFGEWVPDSWIESVFDACKKAPQHRYLFLTKNPSRYLRLGEKGKLPKSENMWYGTTTVGPDSEFFFGDGYNTFASIEPILSSFTGQINDIENKGLKWVVLGAETGNRRGKVVPEREWIVDLVLSCRSSGVPVFMKESLVPVVGEEYMVREFPWQHEKRTQFGSIKTWH